MRAAAHRSHVALLLLTSLQGSACLSSRYSLRAEELQRLAAIDPEVRWQRVRAVQGIGADLTPPVVSVGVDPYPVAIALSSRSVRGRSERQVPPAPFASSSGGGGGSGRSAGNVDPRVIAVIVVGVAVGAFALAAVEGARYDGWIATHPDEPLYLDTLGSVTVVPLSALTPAVAARANGASVYEGSVPRFERLGRAPLDRVGFTLQSAFVTGEIPGSRAGSSAWAYGGRAMFGGFPIQQLGLGLLVDVMTSGPETLARVGVEAQAMPITWVGAYAGGGYGSTHRVSPTRSDPTPWLHLGAQFELPITTRLGVHARAGAHWTGLPEGGAWGPSFALGLAVY